jgi:hypothetical protein
MFKKIKTMIIPALIGFIAGVMTQKSDKGQELLNKIPFLGSK